MSGPTRCAVLGDPIDHSLSPVLHRAGYAALGLDWTYAAQRVAAGGLAGFLAGLSGEWRGLSVTMPLKREALSLVDTLSEDARLTGAVNTVVLSPGRREGHNTDVAGAVAAIRERYAGQPRTAAVLGGGATATSVALALAGLGAERIDLLVREPRRALPASALEAAPYGPRVVVGPLDDPTPVVADLVVSTIPVGAQTPKRVARCGEVPVVFEVVYDPWPSPLARAARESGRTLVTGLDLLVHQAALQFELFTGRPAPLAEMREAGELALAAREVGS
jgi:shikimate dehydrogenase